MELEIRELIEELCSKAIRGYYTANEWAVVTEVIWSLESILEGTK